MTRIRRRRGRERRGLTLAERHFLRTGLWSASDEPYTTFHFRGLGGAWELDEDAAREAWEEHREEIAASMAPGLVPWAARLFDGAQGASSVYEHLRTEDPRRW